LETLPIGRESVAVVGSESGAKAAVWKYDLADPALAHATKIALATTRNTKAERTAGRRL
jgi:hypothetical protein